MKLIDLSGQRFGRLQAIAVAERRGAKVYWRCRCDCGKSVAVIAAHLRSGHTQSCGCIVQETIRTRRTTHGKSESREYRIWYNMIDRCNNPANNHYHYYGKRGIECRFRDFRHFYETLGDCPPLRSLDRIDNDGHYEPGNVRWATARQQAQNTTRNRRLSAHGRTQTLIEWSRETGLHEKCIRRRIRAGWTEERALTQPARRV